MEGLTSQNWLGFTPNEHGNDCSYKGDYLRRDFFLKRQENIKKCNERFHKGCGREEEVSEGKDLLWNGFNKKAMGVCFKGYHQIHFLGY